MKRARLVAALAGSCLTLLLACEAGPHLTFDLALVNCYDPAWRSAANTPQKIDAALTIGNLGTSSVDYQLPYYTTFGFEVTNEAGEVVNEQSASDAAPGLACMGPPCTAQNLTIPGESSAGVEILDLPWYFNAPVDPKDLGNADAPTQFVPPGVYHVSVLLLNGDRTNAATVTVCPFSDGKEGRYGVCNAPCASYAKVCGASLTCGAY